MTDDVTTRMLSVEDAADKLGIPRTSCWNLVTSGRLASVKVGRRRLVPVKALDDFVADLLRGEGEGAA